MDESVVKHLEQQVGTIRLSAAIRIGAKMRPQGFDGVWQQTEDGTSCAIHAAYEALNGHQMTPSLCASSNLSDWAVSLFGVITHSIIDKNDGARWTREQCADYAESLGY